MISLLSLLFSFQFREVSLARRTPHIRTHTHSHTHAHTHAHTHTHTQTHTSFLLAVEVVTVTGPPIVTPPPPTTAARRSVPRPDADISSQKAIYRYPEREPVQTPKRKAALSLAEKKRVLANREKLRRFFSLLQRLEKRAKENLRKQEGVLSTKGLEDELTNFGSNLRSNVALDRTSDHNTYDEPVSRELPVNTSKTQGMLIYPQEVITQKTTSGTTSAYGVPEAELTSGANDIQVAVGTDKTRDFYINVNNADIDYDVITPNVRISTKPEVKTARTGSRRRASKGRAADSYISGQEIFASKMACCVSREYS